MLRANNNQDSREASYNATVREIVPIHEDLMILRVQPDQAQSQFEPGQFTLLGLGSWEQAIGNGHDRSPAQFSKATLIKRAYSISCSLVDAHGQLVRAKECSDLEFYVALVRRPDRQASMLTPRLFQLQAGDRLFCDQRIRGRYTLSGVEAKANVLFASTGTGEAPHNAMLSELLYGGHRGRIVSVVCVREQRDLAYVAAHRKLEQQFTNYRYLTLTTREQVNLDRQVRGYVGKRYLQDYLTSGDLERDAGWNISPDNTHVFLCGNPRMIGAEADRNPDDCVKTPGMLDVLQCRGFSLAAKDAIGNIHYERYW